MNLDGLPPEVIEHLGRVASPAHLAQFVTRDEPPDAQWKPYRHLLYINACLVDAVTAPEQSFLNVAASFRHGKQLSCTTPILTTDGWRTMGEVRAGDQVFGLDGKPVKVIAVSPVDRASPKLRVTTTAGATIDAHPDHEWTVLNDKGRARVIETHQIGATLRRPSGGYRHQLPFRAPVEFPHVELPIPPYILGVWLGDGRASDTTLSLDSKDADEILGYVRADGWVPSWQTTQRETGVRYAGFRGGVKLLKSLGLHDNKHVPVAYEHSSVEQRRALLQGLVDTDGCQSVDGRVRVVGRSEDLIRSVQRIACSLGHKATLTHQEDTREPHLVTFRDGSQHEVKTAGTMWCCSWFPTDDLPPGRLLRKGRIVNRKRYHTSISSVEPVEPADGVCIEVDCDDGLFLVGHNLTPTHNSEIISRFLPVWFLILFPDRQVILVSYNEDKAAEWGEFARNVMQRFGPVLGGISVDSSSSSKTYWKIKGHRGGMRSVGVGGSLTGLGADLICIDDPCKNREEANSETARRNMFGWYGSTLRTRLMPTGTLILTMARWHEDDLTGQIAARATQFSDPWRFVSMPAIAEAPKGADVTTWRDELGRSEGEPLWPEVWPLAKLKQLRASIGPEDWDSLAQQNPTPREGGMFKVDNWVRVQAAPNGLRTVRFWDTAATRDGGDFTVGAKLGLSADRRVYVLDVVRFREDAAGVERRIRQTAESDGRGVPVRMEQGRAGEGKAVISAYKRLLLGFDFDGVRAEGKKVDRARPLAAQQGERNVSLVSGDWNGNFIEEFRIFDHGRHDDQVDATVGAFTYLADSVGYGIEFPDEATVAAMRAVMSRGYLLRPSA